MEVKEIWATFNKELRNYVMRKVSDEQIANDIVQDIFEKVIKNIQKLEHVENLQEYLYKMARNAVVDSFRSRKLVFEEIELSRRIEKKGFAKMEVITSVTLWWDIGKALGSFIGILLYKNLGGDILFLILSLFLTSVLILNNKKKI